MPPLIAPPTRLALAASRSPGAWTNVPMTLGSEAGRHLLDLLLDPLDMLGTHPGSVQSTAGTWV